MNDCRNRAGKAVLRGVLRLCAVKNGTVKNWTFSQSRMILRNLTYWTKKNGQTHIHTKVKKHAMCTLGGRSKEWIWNQSRYLICTVWAKMFRCMSCFKLKYLLLEFYIVFITNIQHSIQLATTVLAQKRLNWVSKRPIILNNHSSLRDFFRQQWNHSNNNNNNLTDV